MIVPSVPIEKCGPPKLQTGMVRLALNPLPHLLTGDPWSGCAARLGARDMLAELNEPANVPESAVGAFAPQRRTIHEKLDEQPRFTQLYSALYRYRWRWNWLPCPHRRRGG